MVQYMVVQQISTEEENDDYLRLHFGSTTSVLMMGVSHILDLLAHPLLTYYFWYRHRKRFCATAGVWAFMRQILTGDVIASAYLFSRVWSLTHTKYNTGSFGLWYVGYDVYVMDSLDSWYPAYIVEGIVYGTATLWKLYDILWCVNTNPQGISMSPSDIAEGERMEKKPSLLWSESAESIDSARARCNNTN
jgi:hypothetical protein